MDNKQQEQKTFSFKMTSVGTGTFGTKPVVEQKLQKKIVKTSILAHAQQTKIANIEKERKRQKKEWERQEKEWKIREKRRILERERRDILKKALWKTNNPTIQKSITKSLGWDEKVLMKAIRNQHINIVNAMLEEMEECYEDVKKRIQ